MQYSRVSVVTSSYIVVYMYQSKSLNSSHHPLPLLGVLTFVLSVFISISALQIDSSVLFF